jgi:hypothetical protein
MWLCSAPPSWRPVGCVWKPRAWRRCRTGVDQAVDRGRLQPGGDPGLAVGPDHHVRVSVGDVRRDARHGEHGRRGGQADGAVDAAHQGNGRVIIAQQVAVGAEPAADCIGKLFLPGSEIGSFSMTGWEESGRPHPARTALNLSPTELNHSL